MARILVLPGDKALLIIDCHMSGEEVPQRCLAFENRPGQFFPPVPASNPGHRRRASKPIPVNTFFFISQLSCSFCTYVLDFTHRSRQINVGDINALQAARKLSTSAPDCPVTGIPANSTGLMYSRPSWKISWAVFSRTTTRPLRPIMPSKYLKDGFRTHAHIAVSYAKK